MVDKDLVKFCSDLRKRSRTWDGIAKLYAEETGEAKITSDSMRIKCKRAMKRLKDAGECTIKEKNDYLMKAINEYKEEKEVDFKTGTITASKIMKQDISLMTPDDSLRMLGYDPKYWEMKSLKVKSWDQATKDGKSETMYSVRYIISPTEGGLHIQDAIEAAKEVFSQADLPRAAELDREKEDELFVNGIMVDDPLDKLLLINQIELHLGKISEKCDTGVDYNTDIALKRMSKIIDAIEQKVMTNEYGKAVIVIGGDFFNSEFNNHTYKGTPQQNDHKYKYLFSKGLESYKILINVVASYVQDTKVILCEGNHARSVEFYLYEALKCYYSDRTDISFSDDYRATQCINWGNNALFFNHGDGDMNRLIGSLTGEYPEDWGDTKNHYLFIGHYHKSEVSNTENGLQWHRIPAPCSTDSWTAINRFGLGTRPSYQLMSFDYNDGLLSSDFIYFNEK